ncbi:MAG: polyphosphate kinase [Bacteroidetes bacterium]|nr:MAG: polyphosphate kinase [Bacteroidota bacterium]
MIKLSDFSTRPPKDLKKKATRKLTKAYAEKIGALHALIKAQKKYAVLIIFQGMDASGKDGAVKNVFEDCTHDGICVYAFKKPTEEEFAHDFLWRVHKQCPAKGEIKIFNRSHYEDVLIQRVHKWIDEDRVDKRFQAINAFEELLQFDNNTIILKFFLHISKEQQEIELRQRIDEPDKNWKHNPNDWKEREFWDEYMRCYEDVLNRSTIPWHIIPVDERWYRDYLVAKTIAETLEKLPLEWPSLKD